MDVAWARVGAYAYCRDDGGRILLTRCHLVDHPDHGKWTMPGGQMEWAETPQATVHRELLEETGLTATVGDVVGVFTRWYTAEESVRGAAGQLVCVVVAATGLGGDLRTDFDPEGTTDGVGWFSLAEVAVLPHVELVDFVRREVAGGRSAAG